MARRVNVSVKVDGARELIQRAELERFIRRPLRKAFRTAAKAVKARIIQFARPVSRSLTRRIRVEVDRAPVPEWARVINRAAWVHVAERGRRPGAKLPPASALRGGFAAARSVSRAGLPGHHIMERAARASGADLDRAFDEAAREIERRWRG